MVLMGSRRNTVIGIALYEADQGKKCESSYQILGLQNPPYTKMNSPAPQTINTPAGKVLCVADLRGTVVSISIQ